MSFVVPAMPYFSPKTGRQRSVIDGYYSEGRSPNWRRKKRYEAWKQRVQELAVLAGVELPLRATKEKPLYIVTRAYYHSGVHCDPENTHKAVVDALFYVSPEERKLGQKGGSDKHTGGCFASPRYDKESPRVEVAILSPAEFGSGQWIIKTE